MARWRCAELPRHSRLFGASSPRCRGGFHKRRASFAKTKGIVFEKEGLRFAKRRASFANLCLLVCIYASARVFIRQSGSTILQLTNFSVEKGQKRRRQEKIASVFAHKPKSWSSFAQK